MKLSELINQASGIEEVRGGEADVSSIDYDSRKVSAGSLFIAMSGTVHDGHEYIDSAIEQGAVAIVAENMPEKDHPVPYYVVKDARVAMGEMSACFYGFPSRKLKLVGVTGTSGKTTVTHLIQSVMQAAGEKAGVIGTLGCWAEGLQIKSEHTTPESVDIQRTLSEMVKNGVTAIAMEASSHGLFQGRTIGCEFDCGVFTNVARDHLDYHKTFEAYLDAKLTLFKYYPNATSKGFVACLNADDPSFKKVQQVYNGRSVTFAVNAKADVTAADVKVSADTVSFDMQVPDGEKIQLCVPLGGYFNVYNALTAASVAVAMGIDAGTIKAGLEKAKAVPGRFEYIDRGQGFGVIVDYAHTPDELENVLQTASKLTKGRLIAVFGCGGDRDRGKRPLMGEIASQIADYIVVTSDNPRTEDPEKIISDIFEGIDSVDRKKSVSITDRYEAIKKAICEACNGDLVVIAGKGHEDYQIFANETIHFDDREVASEILMGTMSQCSR